MSYNNLTNEVTSASGTWTVGGTFSYATLNLESGIPHKDQLEVERIFTLPTAASVTPGPVTVNIKDNISTHDLHRIFIVNKDDYTVNETTKTILTLTPSVAPNTRTYTFEKGSLAGKTYTIPTITSGEAIVVRRKTVSNTTYISWSAGSRLTSQQLNLQVSQLLKLTQEVIYKLESEYLRSSDISGSSAPAFTIGNDLDMGGTNKIINLANPITAFGSDTTSAVNKGFIESHYVNLDQNQNQSINGNKTFTGTTTLSGAAIFSSTATANSSLTVGGTLDVTGLTTLNGGLTMDGGVVTIADTTGNTVIGGTLNVTGAATLSDTLNVTSNLTVDTNTLFVDATNNRVGVGTVSPSACLQVASNTGVVFGPTIGTQGTSSITTTNGSSPLSSRFAFGTDGTGWQFRVAKNTAGTIADLVTITDTDRVGIGTTTPATALDVNGTIKSTNPAFHAVPSQAAPNVGATPTLYTYWAATTDRGSNMGTTYFVAPVTGIYCFSVSMMFSTTLTSPASSLDYGYAQIRKYSASNSYITGSAVFHTPSDSTVSYQQISGTFIVSVTAGEKVAVIYTGKQYGTAYDSFSGYLIG